MFQQHFLFNSKGNCSFPKSNHTSLKSNKLLLEVCWQFLAKQSSSVKTESIPLHAIMLHYVVWYGKFPCLVFYCLTCNRTPVFLFKYIN